MVDIPKGDASTRPLTCASCGVRLKPEARFCHECGTAVRSSGAPASFGARYAAFLVDLTLIVVAWFFASLILQPIVRMLPSPGGDPVEIGAFTATVASLVGILLLPVIAIAYLGIADARSSTIGKRIVGIKVRRMDHSDPGWIRSSVRALVLWGPLLLMTLGNLVQVYGRPGLGVTLIRIAAPLALIAWPGTLITVAARKSRRGLDDLIAGTETVRQ